MFGTRRLAKRSIIGTKICAPWQDGRFYPGVIQATKEMPDGQFWYQVLFDDGYTRELKENDIIGPGFETIQGHQLKHGQKVFLTHNGREITGVVIEHDRITNDVLVDATIGENDRQELFRKVEEIRLLESRKSARLQDLDTDYSKLADIQVHSDHRKRPVSHVIDVPAKCSNNGPSADIEMMDEHMAAMVLTSLSCSPVSPKFPLSMFEKNETSPTSPKSWGEVGSLNSSGFYSSTPSPPQLLSTSAPMPTYFGSPVIDDGIEMEGIEEDDTGSKKIYKCTWPGCIQVREDCNSIEKHVRVEHLHKSAKSDYDVSDHEEEFYYTELELDNNVENFVAVPTLPIKQSISVVTKSQPIRVPDHDYQRKEKYIPSHHGMSSSVPINIPQSQDIWHTSQQSSVSPPIKVIRHGSHERLYQQGQSPKSHFFGPPKSPTHKKVRSEVKKCRKVYGMENRDMWCTQCKWKKACSRFME